MVRKSKIHLPHALYAADHLDLNQLRTVNHTQASVTSPPPRAVRIGGASKPLSRVSSPSSSSYGSNYKPYRGAAGRTMPGMDQSVHRTISTAGHPAWAPSNIKKSKSRARRERAREEPSTNVKCKEPNTAAEFNRYGNRTPLIRSSSGLNILD